MKTLPLALASVAAAALLSVTAPAVAGPEACQWVGEGAPTARNAFADALARGPLYAFLATWIFGLGVSLTPCVYPMIAVTVSIFGARQAERRWQGALLSAVFVLGITTLFVPLGILAAKTGALMGAWLQNPWVFRGIAVLFLVMAASLFGAFDLTLPDWLQHRLSAVGGIGYRGAFLLGLVSALIATPCTGPFLTSLIVWIAESQHTVLGAVMMTAFSLGLGTPFFIVGATAMQLPKSGKWMLHVKTALGIVLVIAALYYLGNGLPGLVGLVPGGTPVAAAMAGAALVGGGLLVTAARIGARWSVAAKVAGIALVSVGTYLAILAAMKPPAGAAVAWQPLAIGEARVRAQTEHRPLLVDFTADWCIACKELDRYTFADPAVIAATSRFVAVKVDLTDDDDPAAAATKAEHRIVGLPTVLLFDRTGRAAVRCTDFVPPQDFRALVERVE
ncbi:MAG: thioredoxin family protein [Polyangiaceae bacterium]|nr:thioredoxin family protein [Polyangiaceae bacterium]